MKRVGIDICVIEIEELRVKRYLLDGYVCGEKKVIQVEGKEYEIQKYQGEHQNEYLISEMKDGKVEGRCELFENGILRLSWMMKDGQRIGRISEYEKGKALFKEEWKSALGEGDSRKIENSKEGLKLVIRDRDNNTMIYQGEFDEELNRHRKGMAYDDNGKLKYEGYWIRDELVDIVREFEGDEMIEYEDCDNSDVLNRIPLYIGGYNVINGEFKRNGIGYLVDRKNGTAIRECKWSNGKELNGIDLFDGWYVKGMNESMRSILHSKQLNVEEKRAIRGVIEIHNSVEIKSINANIREVVIGMDCCNDMTSLNLNEYKRLISIEIQDNCFKELKSFTINGLLQLTKIKIGKNSFTHLKSGDKWDRDKANNRNRSFSILNCDELESIEIGLYSFSDYAGKFELDNLPKLSTIKIGEIGSESYNFYWSSFVIKGNIDMILLMNRSSKFTFH